MSDLTDKLIEFTQFALKHGHTLSAHSEFGKLNREALELVNKHEDRLRELTNVCDVANQARCVIEDWQGHASTEQSARDSLWRLGRALDQAGWHYQWRDTLDWRGSILNELNAAGFYPSTNDPYHATKPDFVYDPNAPQEKRIFGNAVGLTIPEIVEEWKRLKEQNALLLAASEENTEAVIAGRRIATTMMEPIISEWRKKVKKLEKENADIEAKRDELARLLEERVGHAQDLLAFADAIWKQVAPGKAGWETLGNIEEAAKRLREQVEVFRPLAVLSDGAFMELWRNGSVPEMDETNARKVTAEYTEKQLNEAGAEIIRLRELVDAFRPFTDLSDDAFTVLWRNVVKYWRNGNEPEETELQAIQVLARELLKLQRERREAETNGTGESWNEQHGKYLERIERALALALTGQ